MTTNAITPEKILSLTQDQAQAKLFEALQSMSKAHMIPQHKDPIDMAAIAKECISGMLSHTPENPQLQIVFSLCAVADPHNFITPFSEHISIISNTPEWQMEIAKFLVHAFKGHDIQGDVLSNILSALHIANAQAVWELFTQGRQSEIHSTHYKPNPVSCSNEELIQFNLQILSRSSQEIKKSVIEDAISSISRNEPYKPQTDTIVLSKPVDGGIAGGLKLLQIASQHADFAIILFEKMVKVPQKYPSRTNLILLNWQELIQTLIDNGKSHSLISNLDAFHKHYQALYTSAQDKENTKFFDIDAYLDFYQTPNPDELLVFCAKAMAKKDPKLFLEHFRFEKFSIVPDSVLLALRHQAQCEVNNGKKPITLPSFDI